MFNPLKMAGDLKGMEKMLKPALEKFMQDSGFVKESEFKKLKKRVEEPVSYTHLTLPKKRIV